MGIIITTIITTIIAIMGVIGGIIATIVAIFIMTGGIKIAPQIIQIIQTHTMEETILW